MLPSDVSLWCVAANPNVTHFNLATVVKPGSLQDVKV
jgi:hypothetical protein